MVAGAKVKCGAFPEKGIGTVISIQKIFNQSYVDVFFEKTKEKLTLLQDEVTPFDSPEVKIKNKIFSSAKYFLLHLLKDQIKALIAQEGIQSAGNFKILPLPHQLLAVNFIIDQFKPRVLIITPSGLCAQWKEEMKLKFFEDFIIYDRDMVISLKKLHGQETNVWALSDKIITSIDFVKPKKIHEEIGERALNGRIWHNSHVFEAIATAHFDMAIFDEAHKLTKDFSGEETARYKLGKALSEASPILLLLTATPHQGDTAKFKNLLNLIDPYLFYKASDITPDNVRTVTVRNNKRAVVDFEGNRIFKQRITFLCVIDRSDEQDKPELELYEAVTKYVSAFYNLARQQNDRTMMFPPTDLSEDGKQQFQSDSEVIVVKTGSIAEHQAEHRNRRAYFGN